MQDGADQTFQIGSIVAPEKIKNRKKRKREKEKKKAAQADGGLCVLFSGRRRHKRVLSLRRRQNTYFGPPRAIP